MIINGLTLIIHIIHSKKSHSEPKCSRLIYIEFKIITSADRYEIMILIGSITILPICGFGYYYQILLSKIR